jgi:DNA repair exonuclease SbcCD ATPase subunit
LDQHRVHADLERRRLFRKLEELEAAPALRDEQRELESQRAEAAMVTLHAQLDHAEESRAASERRLDEVAALQLTLRESEAHLEAERRRAEESRARQDDEWALLQRERAEEIAVRQEERRDHEMQRQRLADAEARLDTLLKESLARNSELEKRLKEQEDQLAVLTSSLRQQDPGHCADFSNRLQNSAQVRDVASAISSSQSTEKDAVFEERSAMLRQLIESAPFDPFMFEQFREARRVGLQAEVAVLWRALVEQRPSSLPCDSRPV